MIEERTQYRVKCDRCGIVFGDSYGWLDRQVQLSVWAEQEGWRLINGSSTCPQCQQKETAKL